MAFGERLRRARLRRGLSQTELGHMVDRSKQSISRYEKGLDHPPLDQLPLYAEILRVPISMFFEADYVPKTPAERNQIRRSLDGSDE